MTDTTRDHGLRGKPIFSQNPNWRRVFCWAWGHEWVSTNHFTGGYLQWSCLRCYCCVYCGNPWREDD